MSPAYLPERVAKTKVSHFMLLCRPGFRRYALYSPVFLVSRIPFPADLAGGSLKNPVSPCRIRQNADVNLRSPGFNEGYGIPQ